MVKILGLSKALITKFITEANNSGGEEACAVLVGSSGNFSAVVEDIRIIKNISDNKLVGFMMDPGEFLNSVMDTNLFSADWKTSYLGIIHSHYYDRPYPSITDWYGAVNGLYHGPYLIYSVKYDQTLGFYWNGNEFLKMELLLEK